MAFNIRRLTNATPLFQAASTEWEMEGEKGVPASLFHVGEREEGL